MKKTGQKIISAGLFALSVFFVGALSADAELVKLYDPGDLGHYLPTPPHYYALADANWFAHYGPGATLCDATNWADGWVLGASNLMADGSNPANKFRETEGFLWTDDFEAVAPVQLLATIDTRWDNSSADDVFHIALLVDNNWYVSEEGFGGSGVTWHRLDADDLASMNWWFMSFDPGIAINVNTNTTVELSALSGDVSGVGYYFKDGISNRVRTRNTEVYARGPTPFENWMAGYGLSGPDALPDPDFDGDGFTNWQEYIADTDPTSDSSFFSAESITREASQTTVFFESSLDREYELWFTPDLTGDPVWEKIQGPRLGIGGADFMIHELQDESSSGFYRLRVSLPE